MRTGWLSLVGLVLVLPLLVGTLRGDVTLEVTALRVVVLMIALVVVDRAVLPAFRVFLALLVPPRPEPGAGLNPDQTAPMDQGRTSTGTTAEAAT